MPPQRSAKRSTAGKGTGQGTKVRAVPDFSKLHSKWTDKLEKGKACVKKPCTVAQEFHLSRIQTRSRHVSQNCLNEADDCPKGQGFEIDKKSLKSIVTKKGLPSKYQTGRATMATTGVRSKTSIPIQRSVAAKRKSPRLAENSSPEGEFETDASALQSIIDNTGVADDTFLPPTQPAPQTKAGRPDGVFCTPRQPPPRTTHALTEVRKSIYYTGPKGQDLNETNAIYTQYMKRMVSRLTVDGNAKAQCPLPKPQEEAAPSPSPLRLAIRAIPQRHSIYCKYEYPGQQKKYDQEQTSTKDVTASGLKPQRVLKDTYLLKSPASRTPKVAQSCPRIQVNWKDVFGKSPKAAKKDPLATTLMFNEPEEGSGLAMSKLQVIEETESALLSDIERLKESRTRRHQQKTNNATETIESLDAKDEKHVTAKEIAEVEKMIEADIAAMNLNLEPDYNAMTHEDTENRPPKDCLPPTWSPTMAVGKDAKYEDMYEEHSKLVPTAKPVSGKTWARIPFGQLSSVEIGKRSLVLSASDSSGSSSDSSPSSQIKRLSLNSERLVGANAEGGHAVAKKVKKRASPNVVRSSSESPATPKQRKASATVSSGGHRIHQDKDAIKSSGVKRLNSNDSNGNSPVRNSPLRMLSPNVKLSQQRSPQSPSLFKLRKDSPLLLQSSEKKIRDSKWSPCVDQKVMNVLGQENVSPFLYRSPKRPYDANSTAPYMSPKIAKLLQDENISPFTGSSPSLSAFDKENSSPNSPGFKKFGLSPKGKKDLHNYTVEDLNNTLSESFVQYEQLQSEAQLLAQPAENEDASKILNQLEMIKKKQEGLKKMQDTLQRQLLLQSAAKSKSKPKSKLSHSARKKIPFPKRQQESCTSEKKSKRVSFEDEKHLRKEVKSESDRVSSEESSSSPTLPLADSSPEIDQDSSYFHTAKRPITDNTKDNLPYAVQFMRESIVFPTEAACAISPEVPVISPEVIRPQQAPVHQTDTCVPLNSPCPKMAGLAQLVESPYSETIPISVPIRTPMALRNEAERFSTMTGFTQSVTPTTYGKNKVGSKNMMSYIQDMPLDLSCTVRPNSALSIDGVESSPELSSLNLTGRRSTGSSKFNSSLESSKSNRSFDSSGISNGSPPVTHPLDSGDCLYVSPPMATRIIPSSMLTCHTPGVLQSGLRLGMPAVTSRILTPRAMVASPGSLSLIGNFSPGSVRLPHPRPQWPHSAVIAGSALRYEEALCDDEVARYACRLHSRLGTGTVELCCRPTDPVATTLLTGDDTHMVPIDTGMVLRSRTVMSPSLHTLKCM